MSTKTFWEESLDGYNADQYISEFKFYPSKDGTMIPIHISYKKSLNINENTPILIYGYGGFNISILPNFSKRFLSWMNQDGVVAVANLRGGGEYGDTWHDSGRAV